MRQPEQNLLIRLLDSLSDIYVMMLDQDHRVVFANLPFLEHFGLTFSGATIRDVAGLGRPFLTKDLVRAGFSPGDWGAAAGSPVLLLRETNGKKYYYEASAYQVINGQTLPATLVVLRDVTDRLHLESQLHQLFELERNLVQASIDGVIVNDLEGNILIFNEGARKILGYTPEEVIGTINVEDLYPPQVAHEIKLRIYDPTLGGGPGLLENYETVARHKDGSLLPIWLSARLLVDEDQGEIGIVGYFRDLRERKRLEEELLRHERLATLGKMVAHISHEIKNPLMVIGGFARQLDRLPELSEAARHKLRFIRAEIQRLEEFLVNLGTLTRLESPPQQAGNLLALVQEVAEAFQPACAEQGVDLRLLLPPQLAPVIFDPGQIRQVLLNLLKNSLEAMPQGGSLTLAVEAGARDLLLRVADTGLGILPEHVPSLFTPFFTTKDKGSGLGLIICRQLIEQHRGSIEITSQVNQGTTVLIHLPLETAL